MIEGLIAAQTAGRLAIFNGLIKGLFAAQLAVLYVSVVELFDTFGLVIGAHTDNNNFINGAVPSATATDNCFERERKEKSMFDVLFFVYPCT